MNFDVNNNFAYAYNQTMQVINQVKKVIINKDSVVIKTMMAIIANGHILIEDVPGVGKTTLALAFSKSMGLESKRLQFTPDVMPSDIVGFTTFNKQTNSFEYRPGVALCNLFLADEINRTSSRTQSALLQLMEEGKVTIEGETHELPQPYVVIATQNPLGSIGTHPLPDSQLDRFIICLHMGYPSEESEIELLKGREVSNPLDNIQPVISNTDILQIQKIIDDVFIDDSIYSYLLALITATRNNSQIRLGISPRGSIALMRMAKACAFVMNRTYVTPKDISLIFLDTCVHRIILTAKAKAETTEEEVLTKILNSIPKPGIDRRKS